MKKYIVILILSLIGMSVTMAQPPGPPPPHHHHHHGKSSEKLKALRKAYVNDKMGFNEEEKTFFWNKFEEFKKKERALSKEMRPKKRPDFKNMTDAQAEAFYEKKMLFNDKREELKRQFVAELKQKLPFKKIIHLEKIEMDFKREVMKRMKGNRKGRGGPPEGRPPRHEDE